MDLSFYPASTRRVLSALRRVSRWPAAVISNSEAGRVAHERLGLHPRRWEIIPNGFEVPSAPPDARAGLRRDLGLDRDAVVIGMLARFDPMKDHATFMQAAARLAQRHPEAAFVLAGRDVTPDNPVLRRFAADAALAGRIHFLGERHDGTAIQFALDIATLSSAFGEGCPNAIGEAMSCGTPCVATNVGDTQRLIGDTGICVPPRDPDALAAGWEELLRRTASERVALGARARHRILTQFSLDAMVRRYVALYQELAHG
jgi:glycosyltransferase involved in cell wall biosynthesis